MISDETRFWIYTICVVCNMYTFAVGVKHDNRALMGFAGFFFFYTAIGATWFYHKLGKKRERDEADLP